MCELCQQKPGLVSRRTFGLFAMSSAALLLAPRAIAKEKPAPPKPGNVLSPDAALPKLPGIVEVGGSGHLPVLVTNSYEPAMLSACSDAGATVQAVDPMTLEEIFVANVHSRREKQTV